MTVEDLIARLSKLDPKLTIYADVVEETFGGYTDIVDVEVVDLSKSQFAKEGKENTWVLLEARNLSSKEIKAYYEFKKNQPASDKFPLERS